MTDTPSSRRVIVDLVDFRSALLFPRIVGSIAAGLRPGRVLVAFLMLTVLSAAGATWDACMPASVSPSGLFVGPLDERSEKAAQDTIRSQVVTRLPNERLGGADPDKITAAQARRMLEASIAAGDAVAQDPDAVSRMAAAIEAARPRGCFEALRDAVSLQWFALVRAALGLDPLSAGTALGRMLFVIPARLWACSPSFCVAFGIVAAVIAGMGAGALARMNAFDMAEAPRPTAMQALGYARHRLHALAMGPVLPLLMALLCMAGATVLGLGMALPVLDAVSSVLLPIALGLSFVAVLATTIVVVGMLLFAPAVACDGADAVESAQRAGAYILAHPMLSIGYAAIGVVALCLGTVMVDWAVATSWNWTMDAYSTLGQGNPVRAAGRLQFLESAAMGTGVGNGISERISAGTLSFWRTLLCGIESAAVISMVVAASTRVYLLLRRQADGVEPSDIWADRPLTGT